ncbi:MAG: hypothetical protein A3J29_08515 [Acidobacteria bacterium RIFCSPLOWO2_12_FULL_67_14b]|nr:MAG: hypothetical protein A3J29_08515 [Acidobacteria bacterium RIFCSPLOWO2_12_FULL_67_14b]
MAISNEKKASTDVVVEQKVVALAEQIGWFLGTVQAKAEGWLDREKLSQQVVRIRDGAAELLKHVNRASASARKAGAKPAAAKATASKTRASRGPVDAPGKKHRKPPPQESINRRMGEPVGKQMGQKSFKVGKSRGRG